MAGLEAAITLKQQGHHPILVESSDRLGGQFYIAGLAPRKNEMRDASVSRGQQAYDIGVDIRLKTVVTTDLIQDIRPDALIIATGGKVAPLDIPGINQPHILHPFEVLEGKAQARGNIVVIGGGLIGLEVAEFLAEKPDNRVTIVEMREDIGLDLGMFRRICVMENVYMAGITPFVNAVSKEVTQDHVIVEKDGQQVELPADFVVIATGTVSQNHDELVTIAEEMDIPYHIVGDAVKARRALDAISEAAEVARKL